MEGVKNFFDGLASVAEAVVHQSKLYTDEKNDIYHEWFSTLRIRYIRQLRNVENKLKSKIVRQALEDTLQDMLQKNYEETNSRESTEERVRTALVGVLREYFTFRVIKLFLLQEMDNNPNGFNINKSLFFNCLINAVEAMFNVSDAKKFVHEAVAKCKQSNTTRREYF